MNIYVSHSTNFDYRTELYEPLKSHMEHHKLFLPHELNKDAANTKDVIKTCNLIIAEVSYPSTGQGIELGWANEFKVPIVCIHKAGTNYSDGLKVVSSNFIEYHSLEDMIEQLKEFSSN